MTPAPENRNKPLFVSRIRTKVKNIPQWPQTWDQNACCSYLSTCKSGLDSKLHAKFSLSMRQLKNAASFCSHQNKLFAVHRAQWTSLCRGDRDSIRGSRIRRFDPVSLENLICVSRSVARSLVWMFVLQITAQRSYVRIQNFPNQSGRKHGCKKREKGTFVFKFDIHPPPPKSPSDLKIWPFLKIFCLPIASAITTCTHA